MINCNFISLSSPKKYNKIIQNIKKCKSKFNKYKKLIKKPNLFWLSHSKLYPITKLSILLTYLMTLKMFSLLHKKSLCVPMLKLLKVKNFKLTHQLNSHVINRVVYLRLPMPLMSKFSISKGSNFMIVSVWMKK